MDKESEGYVCSGDGRITRSILSAFVDYNLMTEDEKKGYDEDVEFQDVTGFRPSMRSDLLHHILDEKCGGCREELSLIIGVYNKIDNAFGLQEKINRMERFRNSFKLYKSRN